MMESMIFILFYMAPACVAYHRAHRNLPAVTALNLLTGWTGIGWVAAFVWSLTR